jgi:hypothetical protein
LVRVDGAGPPLVVVKGAKSLPHANAVCISAPFGISITSDDGSIGDENVGTRTSEIGIVL